MMTTDFHTHILPEMDDGSQSLWESLQLLRQEQAQGIRRVVLTPHFYPHQETPAEFLQRRHTALEKLSAATDMELIAGAEVYYYPGMSHTQELKKLTLGATPYLLIEMPFAPWSNTLCREMKNIYKDLGLTPVIAHIDRYLLPHRSFNHFLRELKKLPVLVQMNGDFLTRRLTQRAALRLVKDGYIDFLGSDCHGVGTRIPDLRNAYAVIEKHLDATVLARLDKAEQTFVSLL